MVGPIDISRHKPESVRFPGADDRSQLQSPIMRRLVIPLLTIATLASPLGPFDAPASHAAASESEPPAQGRLLGRLRERRGRDNAPIDLQAIMPGAQKHTEAYGPSAAQTVDVYTPPAATGAPILIMVHGGAWKTGDKEAAAVVENKLKHWLPRGFIVVSVNYRLLPEAMALEQAQDVALAVQTVADQAGDWGGDPASIVLMGHSAGAHLVALLASEPDLVQRPIAGAVILDSAALDIDTVMGRRHLGFYDEAFGSDPAYWRAASPADQWTPAATPMMIVCSSRRADDPCAEARTFAQMTAAAGVRTPVLPQPLSHREINETLGLDSAYTNSVDAFITVRLHGSAT